MFVLAPMGAPSRSSRCTDFERLTVRFLKAPKVLEEMRSFLAGVACEDYKIIAFDGWRG